MARCSLSTQPLSGARHATRRSSAVGVPGGQIRVGLWLQPGFAPACQSSGRSPFHREPGPQDRKKLARMETSYLLTKRYANSFRQKLRTFSSWIAFLKPRP